MGLDVTKEKIPFPSWFFKPPEESDLSDHAVTLKGDYLSGKRIAVLITGSIAAMKMPLLVRELRRFGARVTVFASKEALRYVGEDALSWASNKMIITRLTPRSEHLNSGKPYDAYLVVPASYNTINKFANGIADSLVTTTLASALGFLAKKKTQIICVPCMHGSMHNPILSKSLATLYRLGVSFIRPKQDFGKNNYPGNDRVIAKVCRTLNSGPLTGKRILVTAGPTPIKLDSIRRLTNKFSGKLGILVAEDLFLQGADVMLLQAASGIRPPKWLPHMLFEDYDEYKKLVLDAVTPRAQSAYYWDDADYAIFTAAVADYRPDKVLPGKTPSNSEIIMHLKPTEKVIDEVQRVSPNLKIVSFKYEEIDCVSDLLDAAKNRLYEKGYLGIIANSGKITDPQGQVAFLLHSRPCCFPFPRQPSGAERMTGKEQIARGITKLLTIDAAGVPPLDVICKECGQ